MLFALNYQIQEKHRILVTMETMLDFMAETSRFIFSEE